MFTLADGRIALTFGDGATNGIATINADGSDYREIVEQGPRREQPHGGTEAPRWTPDGRILFDSNRSGGPDDWHIFVVGADGGDLIQLTGGDDGIENHPVMSADGSMLVYSKYLTTPQGPGPFGGGGVFLSDADGSNERQVTSVPAGATPEFPEGAVDEWPDISPDGQRIVFARGHTPEGGLYIVNLDGTGLRQIIDADFQALRPRWSPDGEWIVLHGNGGRFQTASANLWVIAPDGTALRQLTFETVPGQAWAPDWSPDGQSIVFTHDSDSEIMDLNNASTCTLRRPVAGLFPNDADWAHAADEPTADIVGDWERDTQCQEIVDALRSAGFDESWVLEYAASFTPGEVGADVFRPCSGAVPLRHSHFFTADGEFGSRDENNAQVDSGSYRLVDDDTFVIANELEPGRPVEVTFNYQIDGDEIKFEPVIPDCRPECFEAIWSVTVAYPGLPWVRRR